jgi:hypothetical protein
MFLASDVWCSGSNFSVPPPAADWNLQSLRLPRLLQSAALDVSPRIGHLHVHIDDLPWGWVEANDVNTISVAGLPPGQHKMLVELVDAQHHVFAGCTECRQTVTFTVPEGSLTHIEGDDKSLSFSPSRMTSDASRNFILASLSDIGVDPIYLRVG